MVPVDAGEGAQKSWCHTLPHSAVTEDVVHRGAAGCKNCIPNIRSPCTSGCTPRPTDGRFGADGRILTECEAPHTQISHEVRYRMRLRAGA